MYYNIYHLKIQNYYELKNNFIMNKNNSQLILLEDN